MTKPLIQVDDEVREMTEAEHKQFLADAKLNAKLIEEKTATAESLRAKLTSLGLTDDELKELLGV